MDSRFPLTSAPLPHLLIIPTCSFASFEACVPSEADLICGRRVQGLRGISCEQGSASSIVNNVDACEKIVSEFNDRQFCILYA
jgi:hypothetical protein